MCIKLLFTSLFFLIVSVVGLSQEHKPELIMNLTEGVISVDLTELNESSPISSINKLAYEQAVKSIVLTKDNIAESLNEAKSYKSFIVTVGVHTIVVVNDFSKSIMSGSWGTRMPWGKGYIQKGTLNYKEDYINNLIGVPDMQRRMMFLFK